MPPLNLEVFNAQKNEWVKIGELKPGQQPGSVSQNKPDGSREVYIFECKTDDSESTIYRSQAGVDIATPQTRAIGTAGLEKVAILKDGESHKISIKTDVNEIRKVIRFTHTKTTE